MTISTVNTPSKRVLYDPMVVFTFQETAAYIISNHITYVICDVKLSYCSYIDAKGIHASNISSKNTNECVVAVDTTVY